MLTPSRVRQYRMRGSSISPRDPPGIGNFSAFRRRSLSSGGFRHRDITCQLERRPPYERYHSGDGANKKPKNKNWRDWPFRYGDGAVEEADGFFRIRGRIDEVINVAGNRPESACLTVQEAAGAAVVPVRDEVKGS